MSAEKLETQVRQEQIAEAALGLIGRHGLQGLSVARVARQIGLVPSAIYRHFDGKERVLDAVLDLIGSRLHGNVGVVTREGGDPLDQLRRLLMRHIELIRDNQGIPRVIFSEELYAGRPERRRKVYEIIAGYLKSVAQLIRRGQKAGRIRENADPDVLAVMFLGLVQPAAILWHVSDGVFDVTKQAERGWKVFREAIQADGRKS
ncbi:MAG: TetR/AcrR family transcriptional regulator [Phycisphaerae bacterium]|nr:TetR/AcrR family transcriptional regulator [Phycisphaerae bacterium]